MDDSEYESTESGLAERKRYFPLPTPRGVFMVVGVAMIVGVLGMAGYIFYKGPDSKSHRLVASSDSNSVQGARGHEEDAPDDTAPEPTTTKKPKSPTSKRSKKKKRSSASDLKTATRQTKKAGRKRRTTTGKVVQNAPQNAPQESDRDDSEEAEEEDSGDANATPESSAQDDSEEEDSKNARRLFKQDPYCTADGELYKCSKKEQPDMMRSYICMTSRLEQSCIEWRPQRLCLSTETNRFGSEEECRQACDGANAGKCGKAGLCECTKLYRKLNYVFDVRRQRCRLVALHECVEKDVGFADEDACKVACSGEDKEERCKLAALEDLVRPCLWYDKLYTHFYDHRGGGCKSWDEDVCASNAFTRLTPCLGGCKESPGPPRQAKQVLQGNATLDRLPTSPSSKASAVHRAT